MSLLGALIGHYTKNGVIQLPLFVIPYEKGKWVQNMTPAIPLVGNVVMGILIFLDFIRFILGFRGNQEQAGRRPFLELGFLGDILIGVGTGVLAKTATEMAGTENVFAEISAAFLAGFAGLSYILSRKEQKERELNEEPVNPDDLVQSSGQQPDPSITESTSEESDSRDVGSKGNEDDKKAFMVQETTAGESNSGDHTKRT